MGESIGANFSIALLLSPLFMIMAIIGMGISATSSEQGGIYVFVAGMLLVAIVSSAVHSIFIGVLYNIINGTPNGPEDLQIADNLFVSK